MAKEKKAAVTSETTAVETEATTAKRTRKKVAFVLQVEGRDITTAEVEEKAIAAWVAQTGEAKKNAKEIQLYVKPEDHMIYFVINGVSGSVEL